LRWTSVEHEALVERLAPFTVLAIMRERTPLTRALIERLPNLKLIVTSGMVNRGIDMAACAERGITVCGSPMGTSGVCEIQWGAILSLSHHLVRHDRDMHAGLWQTVIGNQVWGKTLGVIGLGRLGGRMATMGPAFGMPVIAWSQNLTAERAAECGAERVSKDELLARADVVSINLVLSDRTRGLIGARELDLMKSSAFLINASRGPIVDELALVDALQTKRIAAAALDVFDVEPLPADHVLRRLPNVLLTPHIGYVSEESYRLYYPQMVENIAAWMAGTPIRVIGAA
jgi:phosphoglycerate dehydrogenase-like enzyme